MTKLHSKVIPKTVKKKRHDCFPAWHSVVGDESGWLDQPMIPGRHTTPLPNAAAHCSHWDGGSDAEDTFGISQDVTISVTLTLIFPSQNTGHRGFFIIGNQHHPLCYHHTRTKNKLVCICECYALCCPNTKCRLGTASNNINAAVTQRKVSGKSAVALTFLVSHPKWALHYSDAMHVALFAALLALCDKKGNVLKNFNVLAIRKQRWQ